MRQGIAVCFVRTRALLRAATRVDRVDPEPAARLVRDSGSRSSRPASCAATTRRTSSSSTSATRATTSSSCSSPAARAGTTTAAPAPTASAAPRTSTASRRSLQARRRSSRRSSTATLDEVPTTDWNFVYVPYCTGDVHTGNNVATYTERRRHEERRVPPRRPRTRCEEIVIVDRRQLHARAEAVRHRLLGRRRRLARQLPLPAQRHPVGREGLHARRLRPDVPVERLLGADAREDPQRVERRLDRRRPAARASRSTTWARSTPRSPTSSRTTGSRRRTSAATWTSRSTRTSASTTSRRRKRSCGCGTRTRSS